MLRAQTHCLEPTFVCCRFYALTHISNFLFLAARQRSSWKWVGFSAHRNTLARLSRREPLWLLNPRYLAGGAPALPKAAPGLDKRICSVPVFHQAGLYHQEITRETSKRWRGCLAQRGSPTGFFGNSAPFPCRAMGWGQAPMKPQRGFLPQGCSGSCPLGSVALGNFGSQSVRSSVRNAAAFSPRKVADLGCEPSIYAIVVHPGGDE